MSEFSWPKFLAWVKEENYSDVAMAAVLAHLAWKDGWAWAGDPFKRSSKKTGSGRIASGDSFNGHYCSPHEFFRLTAYRNAGHDFGDPKVNRRLERCGNIVSMAVTETRCDWLLMRDSIFSRLVRE